MRSRLRSGLLLLLRRTPAPFEGVVCVPRRGAPPGVPLQSHERLREVGPATNGCGRAEQRSREALPRIYKSLGARSPPGRPPPPQALAHLAWGACPLEESPGETKRGGKVVKRLREVSAGPCGRPEHATWLRSLREPAERVDWGRWVVEVRFYLPARGTQGHRATPRKPATASFSV